MNVLPRNRILNLKVSDADLATARHSAREAGLTVSTWAYRRLFGEVKPSGPTEQAAEVKHPSPTPDVLPAASTNGPCVACARAIRKGQVLPDSCPDCIPPRMPF